MDFFDAYFKVPHGQFSDNAVTLKHDTTGEIVAENINAFSLHEDSEKIIVLVRISNDNLKMYIESVPEGIEPWSHAGVEAVGLKNSYLGHTIEEVIALFPEIDFPDLQILS